MDNQKPVEIMYKLEDDSIELWAMEAEELFKKDEQPMDDDTSRMFLNCSLGEEEMEKDNGLRIKLASKKLGLASVFYNRVKYCHTYELSLAACLFMGLNCKNFGSVTIYANYLQYQAHKHNEKRIGMRFIGMNVFPWGFPSEETLNKVWDMQKVERKDMFDSDNLLDYNKCQKSIAFPVNK